MLLILLIFKIQIVCVMSSISEIIKIEHETRVDDPTCIRKMYLFREVISYVHMMFLRG